MSDTKINSLEKHYSNSIEQQNNESDLESSDDYKESDSSSDEESDSFQYTVDSDLFVVSIDDVPKFYVKDEKEASKKIWNVAHSLASKEFLSGFRTNYVQISDKEIHILRRYRFFLISYDEVIYRITYSKIKECV